MPTLLQLVPSLNHHLFTSCKTHFKHTMQTSLTCLNVNCKLHLHRFSVWNLVSVFKLSSYLTTHFKSVIQMYCWNLDVMVLRTMYMSSLWLHLCSSYVYVQYIWFHLCSVTHIIQLRIRICHIYVHQCSVNVLPTVLSMFNLCWSVKLVNMHEYGLSVCFKLHDKSFPHYFDPGAAAGAWDDWKQNDGGGWYGGQLQWLVWWAALAAAGRQEAVGTKVHLCHNCIMQFSVRH